MTANDDAFVWDSLQCTECVCYYYWRNNKPCAHQNARNNLDGSIFDEIYNIYIYAYNAWCLSCVLCMEHEKCHAPEQYLINHKIINWSKAQMKCQWHSYLISKSLIPLAHLARKSILMCHF